MEVWALGIFFGEHCKILFEVRFIKIWIT